MSGFRVWGNQMEGICASLISGKIAASIEEGLFGRCGHRASYVTSPFIGQL